MALLKSLDTDYGTATYHVITQLTDTLLPAATTQIRISSYRDQAHYNTPGAKPYSEQDYTLPPEVPADDDSVEIQAAYDWLIANRPEWAGATEA